MSTKLTQKVSLQFTYWLAYVPPSSWFEPPDVSEYPTFTFRVLAISMLLLMATDSKLPLPWPVEASVRFLSIIILES